MIVVSSCLAGEACRYDGKHKKNELLEELVSSARACPVCPECLAGLPTPRPPAEIVGGDGAAVLDGRARVIAMDGEVMLDLTDRFVSGARLALERTLALGASTAVLKSLSPSCGCGSIYDGSFKGALRCGDGVFAALLKRSGVRVLTECEIESLSDGAGR